MSGLSPASNHTSTRSWTIQASSGVLISGNGNPKRNLSNVGAGIATIDWAAIELVQAIVANQMKRILILTYDVG